MPVEPGVLIAPYEGTSPRVLGVPTHAGIGVAVVGRVTLGSRAWLGDYVTIRADGHTVDIGADFHLGDRATVHIAHEVYPTTIGDRVSAGNHAVIHACDVADDCVIGDDVVILDGARIGRGAVLESGSIVYPRTELEGGWLYAGAPAKPVRELTEEQLAERHRAIRANRQPVSMSDNRIDRMDLDGFVAPTARVDGNVTVGEGVGIWYGCVLDAGSKCITIGDGTNIQDNTSILSQGGDCVIGPDVTVGHNVTLIDCRIDSHTLIGIGSRLASGTVVESDVLVAAGSQTEPGQVLTSGHVWAGRPARQIGRMDTRKRAMMGEILPVYRDYAKTFAVSPHHLLHAGTE